MRVQTAINEMMRTISNLKTFINEANLSQVGIDSFNQRTGNGVRPDKQTRAPW
jgi:hypothetical protein